MTLSQKNLVYQFKVVLLGISPPIWRRIQVPALFNFWDLHVAIQDAMGWLDYHLHVFHVSKPHSRRKIEIGIPDDEFDDHQFLPGWEIPVGEHFTSTGQTALHDYDFGDDWNHEILFEGIVLREEGQKYPRCIAGERACPPEDCGGIPGYYHVLEVIRDPSHGEHQETIDWLRGHAENFLDNPDLFNPESVHFSNSKKRWKMAFSK